VEAAAPPETLRAAAATGELPRPGGEAPFIAATRILATTPDTQREP
jgi:hypothetical protein